MVLTEHRLVRRAIQVTAAVSAAVVTTVALVAVYLTIGVPSLRQMFLASGGAFTVAVVTAAVWLHWSHPDVLKIDFKGQIRRRSPGFDGLGADSVVDAIESADGADGTGALLLEISSPGGAVTPSADIYRALEDFDGPKVAVVEDVCASGAYMAAAACDRIYAREDATIGSIGVIGSQVNASDLADDLGIEYEGFTAGEYKDAGHPLKEPSDDERDYIQGLIDGHYDRFVDRVAASRSDLDAEAVHDLEARVFDGPEALELGLIDAIGDEDDAKEYLLDELDRAPKTEEGLNIKRSRSVGRSPFSPAAAVERTAYAFGRGLGSSIEASADQLLNGRRFR